MALALVKEKEAYNPIESLISVQKHIKLLQKQEKELKEEITVLCDEQVTDTLRIDGHVAQRKLTIATVIDTKAVKELLGEATPMKEQAKICWDYV